jgi:hypothetical protein
MAESKEHGIPPSAAGNKSVIGNDSHGLPGADKPELNEVERVFSATTQDLKDHTNYDRVDPDVAKYASEGGIVISDQESKRLKRMIDKRVLTVMVFTYFL